VAAHEVPVVRRGRRARLRDAGDPPRQEPARRAGRGSAARPALPRRARTPRGRPAAAPSRRGRTVRARRPAARARRLATGAPPPARPLERSGALVARSVVHEKPHRHTSLLARWDQRFPEPSEGGGLAELLVAAVRAAVVAPERELSRWFPWWEDGLADRLVSDGRLVRPADGWVAVETASAPAPEAPAR